MAFPDIAALGAPAGPGRGRPASASRTSSRNAPKVHGSRKIEFTTLPHQECAHTLASAIVDYWLVWNF